MGFVGGMLGYGMNVLAHRVGWKREDAVDGLISNHTHVLSPPRGMATLFAPRGSEIKSTKKVPSPLCGMETHALQDRL